MRISEYSQTELQLQRTAAVERQKKRRAIARTQGMCCICCIRRITAGTNPSGKKYTTCSSCRASIAPGNKERQNERRAAANGKGMCNICCVRPVTEGRTMYDEPFRSCEKCRTKSFGSDDRFCVECQAHGFHRADCPTLQPKKKREPMPRPTPTPVEAYA